MIMSFSPMDLTDSWLLESIVWNFPLKASKTRKSGMGRPVFLATEALRSSRLASGGSLRMYWLRRRRGGGGRMKKRERMRGEDERVRDEGRDEERVLIWGA